MVSCFYYVYGAVVEKKIFDKLEDEEKKLFEIFSIPHDIEFGSIEYKNGKGKQVEKNCDDYVIVGKLFDIINFGFGRIYINDFSDEEENEFQRRLKSVKLPTECEYVMIPDSCNCCS